MVCDTTDQVGLIMSCISTPLSEDQLLAAMSGVAEDSVLEHLRQCEFCAMRLQRLEKAEEKFQQKMYRWDCPDDEQLGDFSLNLLQENREQIAEHVKICPACQSDLMELQRFMDAVDQDESSERQSKRAAALPPRPTRPSIRVPSSLMRRSVLQAAMFRGDESQVFEFEDVKLVILVTQEQGYFELGGQLLGKGLSRWPNGLVKAQQKEGRPVLGIINERHKFRCRLSTDGDVTLTISAQDGTVFSIEGIKLPLG